MKDTTVIYLSVVVGLFLAWGAEALVARWRDRRDRQGT